MHGAHAHIANSQPAQAVDAPFFAQNRIEVGQNLGGMFTPAVAAVNNRDGSPFGSLVRCALLEVAHHDHIAIVFQHLDRVFNGFLVEITCTGHLGV